MRITWRGQLLFHIAVQDKKNGLVNIVIDPFLKTTGLKPPKMEADILLFSDPDEKCSNIEKGYGNPFLIKGPGEYDIKQVFVQGIPAKNKQDKEITSYTIEAENLKLCDLGSFGQKELTAQQLEKIGDTDILMLPVGGGLAINGSEAQKIISQIEPKIVIPMGYQTSKEKDYFLKTMGLKSIQPQNKLVIKKKDLPTEMEIVVLEP